MTALADAFHFLGDPRPDARPDARALTGEPPMMAALSRMSGETGVPPMRLMREFAALSFGPGRISFHDFVRLRLHDEAFWEGRDRRTVVGQRRSRELALQINHRDDGRGLAANRLAANAYLAAFGFPVVPTVAIYAHDLAAPSPALLRSRDELREFLFRAPYPLFGRAMEGPGRGAVGLAGCDRSEGVLHTLDGRRLDLDAFVDGVRENHWTGYLFQPRVRPHPEVAGLCGQRLASVRLLTLADDQGPRVARACWTFPGGRTVSDSPVRPGTLLAQLDPRTGAILRVVRGSGFDLRNLTRHPDTGATLIGARVPGWEALKATAVEAARLMSAMPMIAWDIAPSPQGPMILKLAETPDLGPYQIADRQGLLDGEIAELLARQRQAAAERAELLRSDAALM